MAPTIPTCKGAAAKAVSRVALIGAAVAGGFAFPAAAAADREARQDRAVLQALIAANLAEQNGDAARALAEWQKLSVMLPDFTGGGGDRVQQAVAAGDYKAAEIFAAHDWKRGEKYIEARLALLIRAVERRDWAMAARYADEDLSGAQRREWERMFAPILQGWIAAGAKDARGITAALAVPEGGVPLHPAMQAHEAMMRLSIGDKAGAVRIAQYLRPTDRLSQLAALDLQRELTHAGLDEAAEALAGKIQLLRGGWQDPMLLLPARRMDRPAAGIAAWFGMMAESFNRVSDVSSPLADMLARSALQLDPSLWAARLLLAEEAQSLSRFDQALALLNVRGAVPPIARLARADILLELGRKEEALAEARRAVAAPDVPRALLVRQVDILRQAGDDAQTMRGFERLIADISAKQDDPQLEALILTSWADLRLKREEWSAIAPMVERAVMLAPNNADVLNFAGYAAIERRVDLEKSLGLIARAAELAPNNPNIIDSLGWAHYLLGEREKAVPLLEQAWRGEGQNSVIAEHLGDAYWSVGRRFEARHLWRAAAWDADDAMKSRLDVKMVEGWSPEVAAP